MHTEFSVLDGMVRVGEAVKAAAGCGMPALAISDLSNLFGLIKFYGKARGAGLKPIAACDVWIESDRDEEQPARVLLLVQNHKGYLQLCELLSRAFLRNQKRGKATLKFEWFDEVGCDGLIAVSGFANSDVGQFLLGGNMARAEDSARKFLKYFEGRYYIELQRDGSTQAENLVNLSCQLAAKLQLPVVATHPIQFLKPEDFRAHEARVCIAQGEILSNPRRPRRFTEQQYFKTAQEMAELFADIPSAIRNSIRIAQRCNLTLELGKPKLPAFPTPDGMTLDDYLVHLSKEGLEKRLAHLFPNIEEREKMRPEYEARLKIECDTIIGMGFPGYFLIVQDFINWGKKNGVPVGPGRGSGAGSLVAYALGITDLDPLRYDLLFERFLNPERVSMPDFDIDFCQDRRGEVINYVTRKYGADNVCQIITFGKLQTRAVIKDVGRVMGLSFAETDQITKLVPETLNIKIRDAIDQEPRLRELMENDSKVAKIMEYALALEGLYRNAGVHAAGVIITEKPVVTYCPLYIGKDGVAVTQFDKDFAEKIGLVKFDFLGLKTLTVIDNAVELVRVGQRALGFSEAESFSLAKMNYNDPKVYELIGSGDTDGVFQVESSGMKDLCTRLLPNSVEDLTAINALYRPGPLGSGMVDDFIDRKHGRKPIEYELPELESILKDTYGVILYQEQVMQIARELAGYSLGQADMLRRAMGKKKADEMAKHREIFLEGARKKSIPEKKAGAVFDLMAKFAEYGFNKSHSAAYAVLTYQTAYLKAHYPAEFMAALMTTEMSNTDKLAKYISDARAHGLVVLPPDVNVSGQRFGVERDAQGMTRIRFALAAIKGVGSIAVDEIVQSRTQDGPFSSVMDFCRRVSTRKANKKVLESLTAAGAFDTIAEVNRATLYQSLEKMLEHASDEQEERALGQSSLFDSIKGEELKIAAPATAIFQQVEDWPSAKKLANEKQVVGFYVSGHPMDGWQKTCEDWLGWSTRKLRQYVEDQAAKASQASSAPSQAPAPASFSASGKGGYSRPVRKEIRIAGLITELKEITTKKGARMAFAGFEDLFGKVEVIFFPEAFQRVGEQVKQAMAEARPLLLSAEIDQQNADSGDENVKLLAKSMEWLDVAHKDAVQEVVFRLPLERVTVDQLRSLKKHLLQHRGPYPVSIVFTSEARFRTRIRLPVSLRVAGSPQLVSGVSGIFGPELKDVVEMRGSRK